MGNRHTSFVLLVDSSAVWTMACVEFGCKRELTSFQYSDSHKAGLHPPASNLRHNVSQCRGGSRRRETDTSHSLFNKSLGFNYGLFSILGVAMALR
jgi:hypothetical protein